MINDKINAICVNIFIINAKNEIFNTGNGNIRNKKENFTNKYDFIFKHNR